MLEDLQRDYTRDEDWCSGGGEHSTPASETEMLKLIQKHQDQKESFLKACTMARRNAESFLKYLKKCNGGQPAVSPPAGVMRGPETYVKSKSISQAALPLFPWVSAADLLLGLMM